MGYLQGAPIINRTKEEEKKPIVIPDYKSDIRLAVREDLRISQIIGRVIHCNKREHADLFFDFLAKSGFNFSKGRLLSVDNNNWNRYKEKTAYVISVLREIYCVNIESYKNSSTLLNFETLCTPIIVESTPDILERLKVVEGEKFDIEGYNSLNPFILKVVDGKLRLLNMYGESIPETLEYVLENPDVIIKKTYYTEFQKKVFRALKEIFLLNYIVRDSDGQIWGLVYEPKKVRNKNSWMCGKNEQPVNLNRVANLEFIKWEDDEPFLIP